MHIFTHILHAGWVKRMRSLNLRLRHSAGAVPTQANAMNDDVFTTRLWACFYRVQLDGFSPVTPV